MSIKKYEMFLDIIKNGSLSNAAKEMGCTQSAVTHAIKGLEDDLGVKLLVRNKAGIRLTEEGERLLPFIEAVVKSNERLYMAANSINHIGKPAVLRVGTFKSMAVNWLPKIISRYQKENPEIEFNLVEGDYEDIDRWLKNEEVDVCFINMDIEPGGQFRSVPLCEDRLLAVLPSEHPLALESKFSVKNFEKEPVISLIDNTDHDAKKVLLNAGIRPKTKLKTKDEFAMLAMVENGLGICIMPELFLADYDRNVKVMELLPPASRKIGLAVLIGGQFAAETERFAAFIEEWVGLWKQKTRNNTLNLE